ncbi:hypothetical protein SARC_14771 [Sphaeroforma arctica JP610]|uniref:Uncharacterized protein n=1 Tax=Sphaeroforma arctica JP610 TaxID=667725 RepID=A0A0L0F7Z3_9EUKA|nr:hypothetical protein SARC_14771 [Sphaeroforma arctica JP610]KNC72666.1 hypothetical protein SARC_14771 [Sphaeroforma arctica JP610]|eukprot:XP_014146568.1 hypothetical protein SARC_14771 [Sphaeroforma arctica JP610]
MNKWVREGKRQRDDCVTRETTFREHCYPLTLLRKVKLADGTDGEEIIEALAMPMQIFAAVGMPYRMYRGFVPCRPNFVKEVEGTGGVASMGTTVNDPENVLHLEKDFSLPTVDVCLCGYSKGAAGFPPRFR